MSFEEVQKDNDHQNDVLQRAILKAVKNGWCPTDSGEPVDDMTSTYWGCWFYDKAGTGVHLDWRGIIFDQAFCKAFFGEEGMYLIDTSPDWAHDMGDTETAWVTERQLKDYCNAQLEAFYKEYPDARSKPNSVVDIIKDKWEDPFKFAVIELPAWQHHLQTMVLEDKPILYLEKFLQEENDH
jgi:hypothetical protein